METTVKLCILNGQMESSVLRSSLTGRAGLIGGGVSGCGYFRGIINEVKIYSCALSKEEIKASYEDKGPIDTIAVLIEEEKFN